MPGDDDLDDDPFRTENRSWEHIGGSGKSATDEELEESRREGREHREPADREAPDRSDNE